MANLNRPRALRELRDGRDRRVWFAARCGATFPWLPPVLRAFRAREPDVEVQIETVADDAPIPVLLADLVDVALVTKPDVQMDRASLTRLFEDEMVAVVPGGHPWASRAHVTARDFDGTDLVIEMVAGGQGLAVLSDWVASPYTASHGLARSAWGRS
ncbi:LysR family transcriptional regulator [Streptomyces sp. NPDC051546]|uniref:LysR family transcriptional regulator n=1 Tax=Streptomyces sp. NPDC051546 TaxID=3365655 RepID=UPI0037A5CF2B